MGFMRPSGGSRPVIRGLVLAGGKSSRFGSNKAVARYQGVRLIERAVSLLNALDLKPVVAVRKGMNYPFLKCATVYDKLPDLGPLEGIYTAMSIFKNTSFLVLTCDMPALTRTLLLNLLKSHESSCLVTIYSTQGLEMQPFPGVYESALLETIRERLKQGDLSMHRLLESAPARKVIPWRGDPAVFSNINHKEDIPPLARLSFTFPFFLL